MYTIFHFIIVVTFFHTIKCYIRSRENKMNIDEIENNIKIIMKPIKKLTGIFPNHDIEVQFDIEQTQYRPIRPIIRPRKVHNISKLDDVAYLNNPARTNAFGGLDTIAKGDNLSTPLPMKPVTVALNKDLLNGIRRSNDAKTNSTSSSASSVSTDLSTTLDPDKQVVYMKDLKQALEEVEKKLLRKDSPLIDDNQPLLKKDLWKALENCNEQEMKNEKPLSSRTSLGNIFDTLKKNLPLQQEISKPSDEELSWLKIKLPV